MRARVRGLSGGMRVVDFEGATAGLFQSMPERRDWIGAITTRSAFEFAAHGEGSPVAPDLPIHEPNGVDDGLADLIGVAVYSYLGGHGLVPLVIDAPSASENRENFPRLTDINSC